jgi:hypothetical protein
MKWLTIVFWVVASLSLINLVYAGNYDAAWWTAIAICWSVTAYLRDE